MNTQQYSSLERKIDRLIKLCDQLHKENSSLLKKEGEWQKERASLVRKNEKAVTQLKEMVARLQTLEKNA